MNSLYLSPIGAYLMTTDGKSLTELRYTKSQDIITPQNHPVFAETCRWLDLYFCGKKPDFIPQIAPQGTVFQQAVWRELLTIPFGQTVTYGDIARRLQCRSAQAIGQAVHRNPIALIIPCHRVIGSDGSLTGYASGLDIKRQLLQIEHNLTWKK